MGQFDATKGKQALEIRSSLSERRALTDPILPGDSADRAHPHSHQWAKAHGECIICLHRAGKAPLFVYCCTALHASQMRTLFDFDIRQLHCCQKLVVNWAPGRHSVTTLLASSSPVSL